MHCEKNARVRIEESPNFTGLLQVQSTACLSLESVVYIEVLEPRAGSGVRAWCMVGQGDSLFTMEMNMKHAGMAGRPRDGNEGIHAAHAVYGNGIFLEHIITHGKTLEYIHCNCNSVHWHALK